MERTWIREGSFINMEKGVGRFLVGGRKVWVCGFGGVEKLVRSGGRRIWLKN